MLKIDFPFPIITSEQQNKFKGNYAQSFGNGLINIILTPYPLRAYHKPRSTSSSELYLSKIDALLLENILYQAQTLRTSLAEGLKD
ncbi:hypothetical protein RRG08_031125 [Elysia crispata]|uniref:Uncharacterized protein n=1 Tax=Elysia crispata TaxID=231223 RepID=A0AAE0ZFF4_9GAST|nr:hypothetical protein RRG08_031125 [Elysia crispata]